MTNHRVPNDEQRNEEQVTFPYLLTLDNDTELLTDETVDEPASEEEPKDHPSEPVETRIPHVTLGTTKLTRSNSTPNLTTSNPISATTPATTVTLCTTEASTVVPPSIQETLDSLRNKLANARGEITDLQRIAFQSNLRADEHEQRMLTMENAIRQLMLLHPTLQNTNPKVDNPTPPPTQLGSHSKRTLGEDFDNNPPQTLFKRAKTIQTCVAGSQKGNYKGNQPLCPRCNYHHIGPCNTLCTQCKKFGHETGNCKLPSNSDVPRTCFDCGKPGHFKKQCPKRNNNA